jgi:hypothetical protein
LLSFAYCAYFSKETPYKSAKAKSMRKNTLHADFITWPLDPNLSQHRFSVRGIGSTSGSAFGSQRPGVWRHGHQVFTLWLATTFLRDRTAAPEAEVIRRIFVGRLLYRTFSAIGEVQIPLKGRWELPSVPYAGAPLRSGQPGTDLSF